VLQASPLAGPSGLQMGDKVLTLNQCQVKDLDSWYQCILSAINHASPGYCISSDLVNEYDESVESKEITLTYVQT
jgi:hypothetical protein